MTPESLITNPTATAYTFQGNTIALIDFDSHVGFVEPDSDFMLERYVLTGVTDEVIEDIVINHATTKYFNQGFTVGPRDPSDGSFAVTTTTFMWDFNPTADIETNVIPSIWSIRCLIINGLNELIDPQIDDVNKYLYRITWTVDGNGYSTNYFLLNISDPLFELPDKRLLDPCDGFKDDGGTIPIGIDGNPTIDDLGYCNGQGDANKVDQLILENSWVDRCTPDQPTSFIERNLAFTSYHSSVGFSEFACPQHVFNRVNHRYRGVGEETKVNSQEVQVRQLFNKINDEISNIQTDLDLTVNRLINEVMTFQGVH